MGLETDLSVAPYYDDSNNALSDNYHRILFKPGVAVQARELTQLQDILQNQVERFGDNILVAGTIVKGCNFSFDSNYYYAKIIDNRPLDGSVTVPSQYVGMLAYESTSNLYAICVNYQDGFLSQDPNLKTLYFKYINSGANNQQQFTSGSTLQFFINTNPSYANTTNYLSNGDLQIATTSNAVGTGYLMTVSEGIIFQKGHFIQVANNTSVIVSKYSNQPDQTVVGFNVEENIITCYQDTNLYDQASGYTNFTAPGADRLQLIPTLATYAVNATPNTNFFSLVEWEGGNIVKSFQQTQYSDIGNEMARRTYEEAGNFFVKPFKIYVQSANSTYNSVVSSAGLAYIEGHRVEQMNNIKTPIRTGSNLKRATGQVVSANYNNSILVQEYVGNFPSNIGATISIRDTAGTKISSGTFTTSPAGNEIGTAKIFAVEYETGVVGTPSAQYRIYLVDIIMNSGKNFANAKGIYYSGSPSGFADIVLNYNNQAILDQPSLSTLIFPTSKDGCAGFTSTGILPNYIFRTVSNSQINGATGNSNIIALTGIYKYPWSQGLITSTEEAGIVVVPTSISSGSTFANVTLSKSGTVTINTTSSIVTGSGSNFTSEYQVGDFIAVANTVKRIVSINGRTSLQVDSDFGTSQSGASHSKAYPVNVPINFSTRNSTISVVDAGSQQLQLSLLAVNGSSESLSANMSVSVYTNVLIPSDADRALQSNTSIAVKISVANNVGGTTGPWCLGVPFGYNLRNVYRSSNTGTFQANVVYGSNVILTNTSTLSNGVVISGYGIANGSVGTIINSTAIGISQPATTNASGQYMYGYFSTASADDVTPMFILNDGQNDAFFDLSYLSKNTNYSNFGIGVNDLITVVFDAFLPQNTGKGYISIDSYATLINSNAIQWSDIPTYTDSQGTIHDLRNSVDFRPFVQNTAAYQSVPNNAIVNPSSVSVFPNTENYIVAPDQTFVYSVDYYIGRYDKLMLNSYGAYSVVEGLPSEYPTVPADKSDAMTLATIYVPPYPSSAKDVTVTSSTQNKVYKMQDIASMDARIANLEYYTSLSLLEQQTSALTVVNSTTGTNRFKNGIFVDNFSTTDSMDLTNIEFKAYLSSSEQAVVPRVALTDIALQYASGTNVNLQGNLVILPQTTEVLLSNKFATNPQSVSDTQYNYVGTVRLDPQYDEICDVNTGTKVNSTAMTVGQLYVSIVDTDSGNTIFTGYTGVGSCPAGLIQIPNTSAMAAIRELAIYLNIDLTAPWIMTRAGGVSPKAFTMNQTGFFIPPETGSYVFGVYHDDGFSLQIASRTWSMGTFSTSTYYTDPVQLVAGEPYFFNLMISPSQYSPTYQVFSFTVNGNQYSYQPTSGQKTISSSMFARSNLPSAYPVNGTINRSYYNTLGGVSGFPGINIDDSFVTVLNGKEIVSAPHQTVFDQLIPILKDKD